MLTHQQLGTSVDDAPAAADAEQARGPLRIAVIGTGYLGAVHAACMAYQGHSVVAVDADAGKAAALAAGRPPFFEPGLEELLAEVAPTGRLTFTTDYALTAGSDVFFLCVGTPQQQGGYAADTTYVYAAARSVAPYLTSDSLVVGKSTVPIGTAAAVRDTMAALAPAEVTVRLVWNPEFLREGVAIQDTLHPDRFVYGVQGPTAEADIALLDRVYATSLADGTPLNDHVVAQLLPQAFVSLLIVDTNRQPIDASPRRRTPTRRQKRVIDETNPECGHPGCRARTFLQYDHIQPYAQDGPTIVTNLQRLCGPHNRARTQARTQT